MSDSNERTTGPDTMAVTDSPSRLIDPIMAPDAVALIAELNHAQRSVDVRAHLASRRRWISPPLLSSIPLMLADLFVLGASILATLWGASWIFGATLAPDQSFNFSASLVACYLMCSVLLGLYPATGMNPVVELRLQVIAALISHIFLLTSDGIFGHVAAFEVVAVTLSGVACCFLCPVARAAVRLFCGRLPWWGETAILVGVGPQTNAIFEFLQNSPHRGLRPLGIVDTPSRFWDDGNPDRMLGEIEEFPELAFQHQVDWVIVNLHDRDSDDRQNILAHCIGVQNLVVLHDQILLPSLWASAAECAGLTGIRVRDRLFSRRALTVKRIMDLACVLLAAPIVLPLSLILVCWIKLRSPGPVFYGHERIGRGGKVFKVWKLRTMVQNAYQILQQYLDADPRHQAEWDRDHKLRDDPRIIPGVGHLLRKTSLDELPQLWNVFVGQMSLVGPRPIVQQEIDRYRDSFAQYLRVKPGITGLWQISGRNNTSYVHRVRLDSYYVRNWSPWLDYFIILKTFRTIIRREGAY